MEMAAPATTSYAALLQLFPDVGGIQMPEEISRRRMLQAGAAAAAAAAVGPTLLSGNATASGGVRGEGAHGRGRKRPNILFLTCDQDRYPPVYESAQVQAFRRRYLRTQNALRGPRHGLRAVLLQYGRLHAGAHHDLHRPVPEPARQHADGRRAKRDFDPDVFWLTQYTVPTIGNWFRAAGYRTIYKGKGHFASNYTPLEPGTKTGLLSFDGSNGIPDPERERLYLEQNVLDPFGWDGWIGPEPHGANPYNSGSSAPAKDPALAFRPRRDLRRPSRRRDPRTRRRPRRPPALVPHRFVRQPARHRDRRHRVVGRGARSRTATRTRARTHPTSSSTSATRCRTACSTRPSSSRR